jgi:hypothetical protein
MGKGYIHLTSGWMAEIIEYLNREREEFYVKIINATLVLCEIIIRVVS